jgi:hypothetical protein
MLALTIIVNNVVDQISGGGVNDEAKGIPRLAVDMCGCFGEFLQYGLTHVASIIAQFIIR